MVEGPLEEDVGAYHLFSYLPNNPFPLFPPMVGGEKLFCYHTYDWSVSCLVMWSDVVILCEPGSINNAPVEVSAVRCDEEV